MLSKFYRFIWYNSEFWLPPEERKPWTYLIREAWKENEFFWIVFLVSLGMFLGHIYTFKTALIGWLIFSIGYLCGHLFWSTSGEEWHDAKEK